MREERERHFGQADWAGAKVAICEASLLFDTPSLQFVGGTAPYFHDGRYPTLIDLLDANDEQIRRGHGYDHNFVLNGSTAPPPPNVGQRPHHAAR